MPSVLRHWYPWLIVLVYFLSCLIIASHWSPFSVCPSSRQPICCFYSVWYLICFPINQISRDSFSAFSPFTSPCIFPRWTTQSLFIAYYYLLSNAGICLMWKLAESRMIEKKVLVWCMCAFVQACVCVWKSDWKQPIEIAVCHVVPEWPSVRSRDAVTSCPHHHWSDFVCQRDLQDIADVNTSPS